jgi:hypothetical protein
MLRVRSLLLKLTVAAAVTAGVAACDAPSGALAPRQRRPEAPLSAVAVDSLTTKKLSPVNATTAISDPEYCRSGYQVAYREDGTPYCAAIE